MKAARKNAYDQVIADRRKAAELANREAKKGLEREIRATAKMVRSRPHLRAYLEGLERKLEKLG